MKIVKNQPGQNLHSAGNTIPQPGSLSGISVKNLPVEENKLKAGIFPIWIFRGYHWTTMTSTTADFPGFDSAGHH